MSIAVVCPSCRKKLKVPDKAAGRKVLCPKCQGGIPVPELEPQEEPKMERQEEEPVAPPRTAPTPKQEAEAEEPTFTTPTPTLREWLSGFTEGATLPKGLGITSLVLALLSVPVLCIPFVSIGLSGLGLILGLWGLVAQRRKGAEKFYPLVGMGASGVALALALFTSLP